MRPHRCFDTPVRGSWRWRCIVRAILAVRRGNPDEAIALVRESLTRIRELHDKFAFVYALVPLAAAAVLKGDDAWAARILGARDAVTERTGATVVDKSVHDLREQAEREVRARLGPDRWAARMRQGAVTSIDSLMKDIDSALSKGRAPLHIDEGVRSWTVTVIVHVQLCEDCLERLVTPFDLIEIEIKPHVDVGAWQNVRAEIPPEGAGGKIGSSTALRRHLEPHATKRLDGGLVHEDRTTFRLHPRECARRLRSNRHASPRRETDGTSGGPVARLQQRFVTIESRSHDDDIRGEVHLESPRGIERGPAVVFHDGLGAAGRHRDLEQRLIGCAAHFDAVHLVVMVEPEIASVEGCVIGEVDAVCRHVASDFDPDAARALVGHPVFARIESGALAPDLRHSAGLAVHRPAVSTVGAFDVGVHQQVSAVAEAAAREVQVRRQKRDAELDWSEMVPERAEEERVFPGHVALGAGWALTCLVVASSCPESARPYGVNNPPPDAE